MKSKNSYYADLIRFIKKKILTLTFLKLIYSFWVAINIQKKISSLSNIILVYDCKVSPPTYGDFSFLVFLLRFIISKKKKVKLIIITGDYRSDWKLIRKKKIDTFIKELIELANLNITKGEVTSMEWNNFKKILKNNKEQILFYQKIKNRKKIYNHFFNALQFLYFFNKKNWKSVIVKKRKKKMIGIHLRHQVRSNYFTHSYNDKRNIKLVNAQKIIQIVKNKHPNYEYIIFTNFDGLKYFKKLKKISKKIKFSKEISNTYAKDMQLLSKCEYYYSYDGGGVDVFSIFSEKKYYIAYRELGYEIFWKKNKNKIASWSSDNQFVIVDKDLTINKFLNLISKK